MRYGVFADVHSNLEAFSVVMEQYYNENIDRYIFLGDIVGYGGDPKECLEILRDIKPLSVAGNHDWATIGKVSTSYFNVHAKDSIIWTKKQLTKDDLAYLDKFRLTIEEKDFVCVHGSLKSPHEFNYILDDDDAISNFQLFESKICFVGHSHRSGIYVKNNDVVSCLEEQTITLAADSRYIINVGSVGQPRDGDPRASFCVYDNSDQSIQIFRVGYDVSKAASSIINHGLPSNLATRLYDGR